MPDGPLASGGNDVAMHIHIHMQQQQQQPAGSMTRRASTQAQTCCPHKHDLRAYHNRSSLRLLCLGRSLGLWGSLGLALALGLRDGGSGSGSSSSNRCLARPSAHALGLGCRRSRCLAIRLAIRLAGRGRGLRCLPLETADTSACKRIQTPSTSKHFKTHASTCKRKGNSQASHIHAYTHTCAPAHQPLRNRQTIPMHKPTASTQGADKGKEQGHRKRQQ